MNEAKYFSRKETSIIKGTALMLMFVHHFFTFPAWWGEGISYPLIERFAQYFNDPFRICVPIFCFLTGYFYASNPEKSWRYSLRKITELFITYWAVLLPFALIAVLFADYSYTAAELVREIFALDCPAMTFCWYVRFYAVAMLVLPLCVSLLDKNLYVAAIFSFVFSPFLLRALMDVVPAETVQGMLMELATFVPTLFSGYIFSRYSCFEVWGKRFEESRADIRLKLVACLTLAFAAAMCRWAVPSLHLTIDELPFLHVKPIVYTNLDIIYAPFFIWCLVILHRHIHSRFTDLIFEQVGKYSLLMWFASCIFFGNSREIFQPLLYLPRNPLLVLIWGSLLCYVFARVVDVPVKSLKQIKTVVASDKR